MEGVNSISRVLNYKINEKYNEGFNAISKHDDKLAMENPHVIKNFLTSSFMMVNFKIR
jgi:hypothetical protein